MTTPSSRRPRGHAGRDRSAQQRRRRSPGVATAAKPVTGPGRGLRESRAVDALDTPPMPPQRGFRLTRQVVVLCLVLGAVLLSVAYPLRSYLQQRADLAATVAQQRALEQQLAELTLQQAALADPNYIKAEAKKRLQYVTPGDTVYVVRAPALPDAGTGASGQPGSASNGSELWYSTLWDTLAGSSEAAVDPSAIPGPPVTADATAIPADGTPTAAASSAVAPSDGASAEVAPPTDTTAATSSP